MLSFSMKLSKMIILEFHHRFLTRFQARNSPKSNMKISYLISSIYSLQTSLILPTPFSALSRINISDEAITSVAKSPSYFARQQESMAGGFDTCFLASIVIENITFSVQVPFFCLSRSKIDSL